jgi:hypothetical protein
MECSFFSKEKRQGAHIKGYSEKKKRKKEQDERKHVFCDDGFQKRVSHWIPFSIYRI